MGLELRIKFRILIKLLLLGAILIFLGNQQLKAQDELSELLEGGQRDAEKYLGYYVEPIFQSIGIGLANGWYTTGKSHKIGGFDITVTGSVAMVPDKRTLFTFNNSEFETIRLANGDTSSELPTVLGGTTSTELEIIIPQSGSLPNTTVSTKAYDGLDLKEEVGGNFIPVPMVTFGVGLPKNTDLKIRFSPKLDIDNFDAKLRGFAVMHDVKQWIPGLKDMGFELSGFIGYTKISASYDFSDQTAFNNGTDDQVTNYSVNALTFQGILTKVFVDEKLFEFAVYGSVGMNSISSKFNIAGTYDLEESVETLIDPINLEFTSGGPRMTAGFRTKLLAFLTIHADYTVQQYHTLTAGVGINIR